MKYYAKEMPAEQFDFEAYYNEDDAIRDHFWAGGNRDFRDLNEDLKKDTKNHLSDAYYDLFKADEEDSEKEKDSILNYYFVKANKQTLTEAEKVKLINYIKEFDSCYSKDENSIICGVLEIIYGEPFIEGIIRGSSQSDWMEFICPESMKDSIAYIESVLFATGTEFLITQNKIASADDIENTDYYFNYTNLWKAEEVRQWLANQIGCGLDDIVIMRISGEHNIVKYDYEEI